MQVAIRTPIRYMLGALAGLSLACPVRSQDTTAPSNPVPAAPAPSQNGASILPSPLTLDSAIRIALANHRQIGMAESQRESARAGVTMARSAYYPSIEPTYSRSNSLQEVTRHDPVTGQPYTVTGMPYNGSLGVQLTQTIFDMGKRELNMARSRDAERGAEYNVQDVRQGVVLNVTTGWYQLLRSKELVRVAESGADRAKTTLDATRAFVEAGTSAKKDILQAQADYDNAQVNVIQARNNVRLSETALRNAMGITQPEPIVTPAEPVAKPSAEPDSRTVPEYVTEAFANRPDLKRSETDISTSRRDVKLARIEAGPQVISDLGEGYFTNNPGRGGLNENRTISATVSYPLFDAGAARARVRQARASLAASEQQLELSRQDVASTVESAYLSREEARTRVGATETALAAAKENYTAATESQKEGVGTILDVITAQNQLVTAETNAVQAIYDYYNADAILRRAIGGIVPGASAETTVASAKSTAFGGKTQ